MLGKLQPKYLVFSDLLAYLKARGVKHAVLVGLTTKGSVLSSARAGTDLVFHLIYSRKRVTDISIDKVLPKLVDVVDIADVLELETLV